MVTDEVTYIQVAQCLDSVHVHKIINQWASDQKNKYYLVVALDAVSPASSDKYVSSL